MLKNKNWKVSVLIAMIIVFTPILYKGLKPMIFGYDIEKVKTKIGSYLYEKYGEEFVVDRIGSRNVRGDKEFVARIYPKSIIGTKKEGDIYYYKSTASVDKIAFGRLGTPGDSYSYIYRNDDVEKYLLPKAKEIFGNRVRLKVDVEHKVTGDGSWWAGYKSKSLEEMREAIKKRPKHNRIELKLYIYIFDKIDNEAEKEKRRREIFEYIGYLKKEGLFEYLEMGVIFIDERVLAPSYEEYKEKVEDSDEVEVEIDGKSVYLPPMKLRKEMSEVLQKEVNEMSEDKLIESMEGIQKSDLTYKKTKYDGQYFKWIYSIKMLEVNYNSAYQEDLKNGNLDCYNYNEISKIDMGESLEYIYIN